MTLSDRHNREFIELKTSEEALFPLFELCIGNPIPEKIYKILIDYESDDHKIIGCRCDLKLEGLIGIQLQKDDIIIIKHIAVEKNKQKKGIGSDLINEVIQRYRPHILRADTDDDAQKFYKNFGFSVTPFLGTYGIRYHCILEKKV